VTWQWQWEAQDAEQEAEESGGVLYVNSAVCAILREVLGAVSRLGLVVLDIVDIVDGTDGAVVSDDVAGNGDGGGLVAVVWVLESTQSIVSAFFIKVGLSSSVSSVCRVAY
jgi:hypothetical protein